MDKQEKMLNVEKVESFCNNAFATMTKVDKMAVLSACKRKYRKQE